MCWTVNRYFLAAEENMAEAILDLAPAIIVGTWAPSTAYGYNAAVTPFVVPKNVIAALGIGKNDWPRQLLKANYKRSFERLLWWKGF